MNAPRPGALETDGQIKHRGIHFKRWLRILYLAFTRPDPNRDHFVGVPRDPTPRWQPL